MRSFFDAWVSEVADILGFILAFGFFLLCIAGLCGYLWLCAYLCGLSAWTLLATVPISIAILAAITAAVDDDGRSWT